MTGKHIHVTASTASVDYFAALAEPATFNNASLALILPSPPSATQTSAQWQFPDNYNFTYYSCLQNPGPTPVTVNYYYADGNLKVTKTSAVVPPYGLYVENNGTLANTLGSLYMTASAPLRMSEYFIEFGGGPGGPAEISTSPVLPIASLGLFGISGVLSVPVLNWQLGTPAPQPVVASVSSGFPFTVSVSGGAAEWLQVTPNSGGSGTTSLTLTPSVSSLGAGTYTGTVTLTENLPPDLAALGPNTSSFTVTLNASAQPTLVNANGSTQFIINPGGSTPAPSVLMLTTNGTPAPFTASVVPVSGGNWLSVTPSSGTTPGPLTLTANPTGLASGIYSSNLVVQGPSNSLTVRVDLVIAPTTVTVNPTSVSFSLAPGQSAPVPPQILQLVTGSPNPTFMISVSTQTGGNWLTASPGPIGSVQVSASAVHLGPGTYQGTLTIVATAPVSGTVTVPVTLTVTAPPGPQQFTVSPSGLTLSGPAGAPASGNLSVNVVSGPPYFSIPSSTVGFKVTPSSSTTEYTAPAAIQVSAKAAVPGTYQYSITISWNGGSAVVPVTFIATATSSTPPVMDYITSSGSATPGSIAPGELISIFGSGLGGAPASLQLNSDLTLTTNLGGTEVLVNGTPAPMIYTSTGQVNAIVPYEVASSGTASVQVIAQGIQSGAWAVPVIPALPSIFTYGAVGVGQGAIVNQDGSVNYETNPAARGTAIEIYSTGGGQTSPLSSTGSVARVAASLTLPVTVTIGGVNAQVLYAGNAPGEVEGVVQINALVPQNVNQGAALPVVVTIGGVASQPGVTIAVQ
jgi:uncharacterized protein (TIGR03437 family)